MFLAGHVSHTIRSKLKGRIEMGKIVVSEFVTLDGVMEDPGGSEDFEHGGWSFEFDRGAEGDQFKLDELIASDALLLGRVTYEAFAAAWPSRNDEAGFAEKLNGMRKYVVSSTLEEPLEWNNSTLLKGDLVEALTRLREQPGGEIMVNGSNQLVQTLLENDLVDEYRLMVFPVVLGSGKRIFENAGKTARLRLTSSQPVGPDGVIVLIYEPASKD